MHNIGRFIFNMIAPTVIGGGLIVFSAMASTAPTENKPPKDVKIACKSIDTTNEKSDGLDIFVCKKA